VPALYGERNRNAIRTTSHYHERTMMTRKTLLGLIKARLAKQDDELLRKIETFLKENVTVLEAGKIGGDKVKRTYGVEFFSEIGAAGGTETKRRHGAAHYQRIGAIGGRSSRKDKE
jgi:hypothetical protein